MDQALYRKSAEESLQELYCHTSIKCIRCLLSCTLVYNVLIALFLVYLFKVGHLGGVLLWPAVVLHAVVALLLVWTYLNERSQR